MSMPAAIVAVAVGNAGVAAIIGSRIFPVFIPPQVFDGSDRRECIVYRTVGVERRVTTCGTDELTRESIAFDCCAETYGAALALAAALRAALLDYSGVSSGTGIAAVQLESEFDVGDPEPGLYRRSVTFSVWHRST